MVGEMFATQNKLEVYQTLPLYAKGRQRQTNSHIVKLYMSLQRFAMILQNAKTTDHQLNSILHTV